MAEPGFHAAAGVYSASFNSSPRSGSFQLPDHPLLIMEELPGVFLDGVQYYDLKGIGFLSSTSLAGIIGLIRILLKQGITVRFINTGDRIRSKIISVGLERIINCI